MEKYTKGYILLISYHDEYESGLTHRNKRRLLRQVHVFIFKNMLVYSYWLLASGPLLQEEYFPHTTTRGNLNVYDRSELGEEGSLIRIRIKTVPILVAWSIVITIELVQLEVPKKKGGRVIFRSIGVTIIVSSITQQLLWSHHRHRYREKERREVKVERRGIDLDTGNIVLLMLYVHCTTERKYGRKEGERVMREI